MSSGIEVRLLGPLEVVVPGGPWSSKAPSSGGCSSRSRCGRPRPCRSTSWSRRSGATRRPTAASRRCRSRSRACARASASSCRCAGAPRATRWRSSATRSTAAASRRCSSARASVDRSGAAEQLTSALALWRGPALADHRFDKFAQSEIARLEELHLEAIEERLAAELARGQAADLVGELRALVAEHPLRERLRGQLMLALYRAGRQADALEVMREGRRLPGRRARPRARAGAAPAGGA